uniref:ubiquitinyl hydrolase 1 n=2 Tax=Hirondellea gigas TaxID=1518452 RepID=A0A6A7FNT3_9CRUS
MPVAPSVSSYFPSSRTSYYRSTPSSSTSSLLNRTTSLDRSSYSSYTPSSYSTYSPYYSSGYSSPSKYSSSVAARPPRPSYSSSYSSDNYKTRSTRDPSPVRSSYSARQSSESRESESRSSDARYDSAANRSLGSRSISDTSSRYASSTISSRIRDGSISRDSGYGSSRLTSRDRSIDVRNGNASDTNAYGPSASSYASNYRWDGRNKNTDKTPETESTEVQKEKVKVSDRIRNYESIDDETPIVSSSTRSSATDEAVARRQRDDDHIAARRQRLGLSPIRSSRSKSPDYSSTLRTSSSSSYITDNYRTKKSPERNGNEEDEGENECRQSVSELRRKYDTSNHNGYTSTSKEDETTDDYNGGSSLTTCRDTPTIRCESPTTTTSSSRRRTDSDTYSQDSPSSSSIYASEYRSSNKNDSDKESFDKERESRRLDSPVLGRRTLGTPPSKSPDGRRSPLTNGTSTKLQHLDDPSCSSSPSLLTGSTSSSSITSPYTAYSSLGSARSSYYSRAGGNRSDRVRERIAARLARELDEDDDCPSVQRCSTGSGGGFSETSGLVGLRNIGNTCFLNSVTQCLSNTRCLLEYLVKERFSGDINTSSLSTMKGDLIRAFGMLMGDMWSDTGDNNRALNTGPFKTQIQRFAPTFTGYQQHDAQEFLRKLLEGLHEDVNRVTIRPRAILTDIDEDLSDDQKAMESWKRYLRFDDSKIVDMFVGQLKSSLQCSYCSHTSVTFDPFWDLSLPIPNKSGTVKMNQCLDLFTKEEVMDGDEKPTCSKCKERRKMTKSFNIQKFPKVLVLHLKRFSPTERWRGKLSCTVEFPVEGLDLARYASNPQSSCMYNLIGVANHSGTTYSGHYTAFCRHPYSLQWHEYNDSRVSSIPARRVCSSEAYVLFYELSSNTSSRL